MTSGSYLGNEKRLRELLLDITSWGIHEVEGCGLSWGVTWSESSSILIVMYEDFLGVFLCTVGKPMTSGSYLGNEKRLRDFLLDITSWGSRLGDGKSIELAELLQLSLLEDILNKITRTQSPRTCNNN